MSNLSRQLRIVVILIVFLTIVSACNFSVRIEPPVSTPKSSSDQTNMQVTVEGESRATEVTKQDGTATAPTTNDPSSAINFPTINIPNITFPDQSPSESVQTSTTGALCQSFGSAAEGGDGFNSAPLLVPGLYVDTIADNEFRYYAVELAQGQRLQASALLKGQADVADGSAIETRLRLYNPLRTEQQQDSSGFIPNGGREDVSRTLLSDPIANSANTKLPPGRYYLSFEINDRQQTLQDRRLQLELNIAIINAADGQPVGYSLPTPQCPAVTLGSARGGPTFSTAPILVPGQYTDIFDVGDTRYYAIDLQPGRRLRTVATIIAQADRPSMRGAIFLRLYDASWERLENDSQYSLDNRGFSMIVQSAPVAERSGETPISGRLYFSFTMLGDGLKPGPYPVELLIEVIDE
jgi:hypothetical protein